MAYRLTSKTLIKLGKNVRRIRKDQKKQQEDVAFVANIEPSYYAKIERGEANPSLEKIYCIIRALDINSSDILPF
ncbi:transcriptional regulator [Candidatus Roizmanbacteria bacterium CG22_combo_CG10-13_8_21_14_all_38_20]|uniref:Transcriptional regulator n=1 Tax=Candidatus Roizmanbacteria bacterium CG22_combo_CG10-13_8_21_14_all_38_20 TaxID=1974862 RepID=A0A2H0BV03_9BACT|nr:helix-turn-helix transcriptional regulator [Candidatus Microgenomates bacterium]PIP61516.1 MAG: transcriptional regulator [Candidatus Roizmanbacteria bacterium CG22_combo_CG10-13_8_21_14_all_38_20]PJC32282.1 MAG: transcriptional regulator [Candidatus Roizmanbacteria bacterium CG_4_9_14_0_2_um_filter_38_17]